MVISLPSMEPARVSLIASAVLVMNGDKFSMHTVFGPVYAETPVLDVTLCTACGCRAAIAVRSCQTPVCPSRDRKAA
jgi:hypothetical protein